MSARAVARLSSCGDVLAVLPSLCGFQPAESLVAVSLRGPRKRVGLTVRVDLPPPVDEPDVARLCADRMTADGAEHVLLAVYSEGPDRTELVEAVRTACAARRTSLLEALHVRDDRWTSYSCRGPCCPPSGTPLSVTPSVLSLVQAEQAAAGRVVLSSRDELVRSVAGPTLLAAAAAEQLLDAAAEAWRQGRRDQGEEASRRATLEHARGLLDQVADGGQVEPADAALLTVGLGDVAARDAVAGLLLTRSDELLSLLLQVARQVTAPRDAPVCTLLAWTAYSRGDGALANVALDRALTGAPDYSLALLLRAALDAGVPPDEVRRLAAGTGRAVRRDARRTARRRDPPAGPLRRPG